MRGFCIGLMLIFVFGCSSQSMEIIAENQSGQTIRNVVARAGDKSVEFGVLIDGGEKHFMTAEQIFDTKFPSAMTMSFFSEEGKTCVVDVRFEENTKSTRLLRLLIGPDMKAIGSFE